MFKRRHFDRQIIVLCVSWYTSFKLSLRDLVIMIADRGISVTHTTILRWVQRYLPEFEKRWRRYASSQYLNNLVEQDHRRVKQRIRPMLGFKRFDNAVVTISGIELAEKIKKGQFKTGKLAGCDATITELWKRGTRSLSPMRNHSQGGA
jgi:transposase-like protein